MVYNLRWWETSFPYSFQLSWAISDVTWASRVKAPHVDCLFNSLFGQQQWSYQTALTGYTRGMQGAQCVPLTRASNVIIVSMPWRSHVLQNAEVNNCTYSLRWCHDEHDGVSNHQPHDCFLNRLFKHRSKKTSKPRVTCLCEGNSPVTGEFPAQRASNAENVSIWWRHHGFMFFAGSASC